MSNFFSGFKCFHGRLTVPPHGWSLMTGRGIVRLKGGAPTVSIARPLPWHSINAERLMTQDTRFVADTIPGKLTKWLWVMGFDVRYDTEATDAQLLCCAEADNRTPLKRVHSLIACCRLAQRLYTESDYYQQVRQVVQAFNLAHNIQTFTSRDNMSRQLQVMLRDMLPITSKILR